MSEHHKVERGATKQDYILMTMTFLVGLGLGFYLYVTAFAPQFNELVGQTQDDYSDFVIEGEQYGGDRRGGTAASFQVRENGTYSYLPYAAPNETTEVKEGQLPQSLMQEVTQTVTESSLESASQPVTRGDCFSYVDGVDSKYIVTLNSTDYIVDTCTTALNSGSILATTLDKLWNYFETLE